MIRIPSARSAGAVARCAAVCLFLCGAAELALAQKVRAPARERGVGVVALVNGDIEILAHELVASEIAGRAGEHILLVAQDESNPEPRPLGPWNEPKARIDLDPTAPNAGNDRHWADRLEHAGRITLSGGDSKGWFMLLMPGGTRSALGRAIQSAHRAGACIVAQGAAAPLLGEWALIDTALFGRVQRNPRQASSVVGFRGLDLVHGTCIESSDATGGSLARCLANTLEFQAPRWLYLDGPIAWVGDGEGTSWRSTGPGVAIVLDLSSARRQRDALRTGRFTLVSNGGSLDLSLGDLSTALESIPIELSEVPRSEVLAQALDTAALLRGVRERRWIQDGRRIDLVGRELRLSLWTDERSRCAGTSSPSAASLALVAFDLERTEP